MLRALFIRLRIPVAVACGLVMPILASAQQLSNPTAYRITYQVEIANISCDMDTLEVWIPNPTEWIPQRSTTVEEASPSGSNTYSDGVHGNGVRHWLVSDPPNPGESVTLEEIFTYVAYDVSHDIDPGAIGAYDPSSDIYQTYTVSEDKIESAHPDIQAAAWAIVGGETNPYEKAVLIYDWVMGHLAYQDTPGFGGALQAYHDGFGECGDYAALFCALLRAVGVPARTVAGWIAETGHSHHVWAEFYLPSYGWIPTDPSWDDGNLTWEYFGSLPSSGRFISSVGVNIELAADWTTSLFQTFSWRWWGVSGERNADCSITVDEIGLDTSSVFRVDVSGDLHSDGTVLANTFASPTSDVAEWVSIVQCAEPGDVLELAPVHSQTYRLSTHSCSALVSGVVSTDPGVVLGGDLAARERAILALTGIVPVKVTDEGGPIAAGDLLITSSTPGHAMCWRGPGPCPCALVGKALEPMTNQTGMILVLLTAH